MDGTKKQTDDRPSGTDELVDAPGVLGRLRDLVQLGGRLSGLATALFGETVVVEDLARGLELWRQSGRRHAFVTLEGDRRNFGRELHRPAL